MEEDGELSRGDFIYFSFILFIGIVGICTAIILTIYYTKKIEERHAPKIEKVMEDDFEEESDFA